MQTRGFMGLACPAGGGRNTLPIMGAMGPAAAAAISDLPARSGTGRRQAPRRRGHRGLHRGRVLTSACARACACARRTWVRSTRSTRARSTRNCVCRCGNRHDGQSGGQSDDQTGCQTGGQTVGQTVGQSDDRRNGAHPPRSPGFRRAGSRPIPCPPARTPWRVHQCCRGGDGHFHLSHPSCCKGDMEETWGWAISGATHGRSFIARCLWRRRGRTRRVHRPGGSGSDGSCR